MSYEMTEYALQVACDLNGCLEQHPDNGEVLSGATVQPRLDRALREGRLPTVNGHACRVLRRTVEYGDWTESRL